MTFWRSVTALLAIGEDVFNALARILNAFGAFFQQLSKAAFALEQEHARKYFALTGLDPARADGDDERYMEVRITAGAEERPAWDDHDERDADD